MIICRLCGKTANETKAVLVRVNEKGVTGIWECRPICGTGLPDDERILAAIDGRFELGEKENG
jgi:hypothetical protein